MNKTPITEEWLNRNGKRMDELYEQSFQVKEWFLYDGDAGRARVIWSLVKPFKITVCAFSISRDVPNVGIVDRESRIIGVQYVEEIAEVLRFCGYDNVVDKFKY